MSPLASWPRMRNWSPASVPPSPMLTVMPGTSRNACSSVVMCCSWMSSWGTTLMICGRSCTVFDTVVERSRAWSWMSGCWAVTTTSATVGAGAAGASSAKAHRGARVAAAVRVSRVERRDIGTVAAC